VLPYGIAAYAKYGCTFSNWCMQIFFDVLQQQKTIDFLQILYCLKVIFLQRVFEALNNGFSYWKNMKN
jgi:hypothetical protein